MYISELNLSGEEVLVYLRKSRSDDPSLSVEEVLAKHSKMLHDYADSYLSSPVPAGNIYREIASSETIDGRPEMLRLLKRVESDDIKAVLIVEPQRLSRGDLEDCGRIIRIFRYTQTLILTPYKVYDLEDEFDRDAFERELKRGNDYLEYYKRIQARGKLLSIQDGNFLGSVPPYGYERAFVKVGKKQCPTLKVVPEQAEVVKKIFELYTTTDAGAHKICRYLNDLGIAAPGGEYWQPFNIYKILENEHYIGKVKWFATKTTKSIENQDLIKSRQRMKDYLLYDGKHEAIVSEDVFYAAAAKKGQVVRAKKDTAIKNPLAGLLHCSMCGYAMFYRTSAKSRPRFACLNRQCDCASTSADAVLDIVANTLATEINNFKIKIKENTEDTVILFHEKQIQNLSNKLNKLETKELTQWDAYSSGEMPKEIFRKLNAALLKEREELQASLAAARASIPKKIDYEAKIAKYTDALNALQDDTVPACDKNSYLKQVIDDIIYTRQRGKLIKVGTWDTPPFSVDIRLKL